MLLLELYGIVIIVITITQIFEARHISTGLALAVFLIIHLVIFCKNIWDDLNNPKGINAKELARTIGILLFIDIIGYMVILFPYKTVTDDIETLTVHQLAYDDTYLYVTDKNGTYTYMYSRSVFHPDNPVDSVVLTSKNTPVEYTDKLVHIVIDDSITKPTFMTHYTTTTSPLGFIIGPTGENTLYIPTYIYDMLEKEPTVLYQLEE